MEVEFEEFTGGIYDKHSNRGGGSGPYTREFNLSEVNWLHTDVSTWEENSRITKVEITPTEVGIYHTASNDGAGGIWPVSQSVFPPDAEYPNGAPIEGNPWIFAFVNGQWHGATFEYLRPGRQVMHVRAWEFGEDQIRRYPLDTTWMPRSGDRVGFMMSTLARTGLRSPQNYRTQVYMTTWPHMDEDNGGGGGGGGTTAGMTNRFEIVQQVAAETDYPNSGIHVTDFTQIVAERLHREDANWGRRLNDSGVIGKDTVAYKTSTGHPYSIDIVAGSMSSNPQPHWSEHGVVGGVWIKP